MFKWLLLLMLLLTAGAYVAGQTLLGPMLAPSHADQPPTAATPHNTSAAPGDPTAQSEDD